MIAYSYSLPEKLETFIGSQVDIIERLTGSSTLSRCTTEEAAKTSCGRTYGTFPYECVVLPVSH